jgi:spermidine synthase
MAETSDSRVLPAVSLVPSASRVLLVGLGTGHSAADILRTWPRIALTCVEIDENQIQTLALFETDWLRTDPRVRLVVDDGRQFLLRDGGPYDVIIVDTWGQEINQEFYNVDFFAEAATALAENGVFYVKMPGSSLSADEVAMMLRTAAQGFPHAYLVQAAAGLFPGLVGARRPLALPPVEERPDLPEQMRSTYARTRPQVLPIDDALLAKLPGKRVNSDDRPYFFPHPDV